MNIPIDTLAFAQNFEEAGFGHDQARALASAFGKTYDASVAGQITRDVLKAELAEFQLEISRELSGFKLDLSRDIAKVGTDVSGRLWSTVTIIAGVATAVSATIAAAVALLLRAKGL